jgi:hypothetical protein
MNLKQNKTNKLKINKFEKNIKVVACGGGHLPSQM